MLQRIPDVPEGIDAFTVVGTLTADDYEHTIEPLLDEARRQDRRLRILLADRSRVRGLHRRRRVGQDGNVAAQPGPAAQDRGLRTGERPSVDPRVDAPREPLRVLPPAGLRHRRTRRGHQPG